MAAKSQVIPESVVERLTRYYAIVQDRSSSGGEWISSKELAGALGLTSSTVRQDLTHVDFYGRSKRGYATDGLRKVLARLLGADTTWKMIVIGAGNLGQALSQHEDFQRRGFAICGIFDNDRRKIGSKIGNLVVQPVSSVAKYIAAMGVDIGVIAVPAPAAPKVADLLVAGGIRGILNLTTAYIETNGRVPVMDSRIVARLLELTHSIKRSE